VPIEKAIMAFCTDRMNLSALMSGGDRMDTLRDRLQSARLKASETEKKLEKLTDALMAAEDGATPLIFIRKARELEAELNQDKSAVQTAERELASASSISTPELSDAWSALLNGVNSADDEARMMARQLVSDTFERIAIYSKGFIYDEKSPTIGLVLVAKGGGSRILIIDKQSGEWKATEDFAG
jgi:hypothetical protein